MFATLEEHNANPPSTWTVKKAAPRIWHLNTSSGGTLEYYPTKKAAEAAKVTGRLVRAYEDEGRWMGGETPRGYRSYAACLAERDRLAARWCKALSHENCTHGCHPDVEDHTDCTNPSCAAPDEPMVSVAAH